MKERLPSCPGAVVSGRGLAAVRVLGRSGWPPPGSGHRPDVAWLPGGHHPHL